MEENSKNIKNNMNYIPFNLINNIPKAQSKKDVKKKPINKRASNHSNLNNNIAQAKSKTISNNEFISLN